MSRFQGGVLQLGPAGTSPVPSSGPIGGVIAEYARSPGNRDFVLQFDYTRNSGGGDFYVYFRTSPAITRAGSSTATVATLRTRFNRRTGKVELKKNGLFNRNGFLKFKSRPRLNHRQVLRGYR